MKTRANGLHVMGVLGFVSILMSGCLGSDLLDGIGHGPPHDGAGGRTGSGGHSGGGGAVGGGQVGDACGGFAARPCAAGLFCEGPFPELACAPDVGGTCQSQPQVCEQIYAPVCGCDRKTYANDCIRQAAGVSKFLDGACPAEGTGGATGAGGANGGVGEAGSGEACGGFIANARHCAKGLFCEGPFPELACVSDVGGTCQRVPEVCPDIYQPVCGCDCKTYGNDCARQVAGVSKRADGACDGGC